jgi:hypothetical protein
MECISRVKKAGPSKFSAGIHTNGKMMADTRPVTSTNPENGGASIKRRGMISTDTANSQGAKPMNSRTFHHRVKPGGATTLPAAMQIAMRLMTRIDWINTRA